MIKTLRPYQQDAVDAIWTHLRTKTTNPICVMPTGSGKSLVIAELCKLWSQYSGFRAIVLAHRRKLVTQNCAEYIEQGGLYSGIYCASIDRRDIDARITFAMIQSVAKQAGKFPPINAVIIDEAHRVPLKNVGRYREFCTQLMRVNPRLRVIGLTATPYRLDGGSICHDDYLLNEVCYEAYIPDLIKDGFLCPLYSCVPREFQPDTSKLHILRGDYVVAELEELLDHAELINNTVANAVEIIRHEKRKKTIVFCVSVKHSKAVAIAFRAHGLRCAVVCGDTVDDEREKIDRDFKAGFLDVVCNVEVYTEGYNVKDIDCVVLLRPTKSKNKFVQMCGRGFRTHPSKKDCLILDYAHCIDEFGPIDEIGNDEIVMADCGGCSICFPHVLRKCPRCGWEITKMTMDSCDSELRQRRLHKAEACRKEILSRPFWLDVDAVYVARHRRENQPDTIRVDYRCGIELYSEWLAFDHNGEQAQRAQNWYLRRFADSYKAEDLTVNNVFSNMFLADEIKGVTKAIQVKKNGNKVVIMDYEIRR